MEYQPVPPVQVHVPHTSPEASFAHEARSALTTFQVLTAVVQPLKSHAPAFRLLELVISICEPGLAVQAPLEVLIAGCPSGPLGHVVVVVIV